MTLNFLPSRVCLGFQDPEANVESEVLRMSLRLCRSRYPCIHLAADVLSGLARYQDRVAVKAVDSVLEAIQRGIEVSQGVGKEGRGEEARMVLGEDLMKVQAFFFSDVS